MSGRPETHPPDHTPPVSGAADWPSGRVHVYTGDGKGKTTAALGLALRAAGAGLRVRILQFCKPEATSEAAALPLHPGDIRLETAGAPGWIRPAVEDVTPHREAARGGLDRARALLAEAGVRVVVLDEFVSALALGLLDRTEAESLLAARPEAVELVLTGRDAPGWLVESADLVTEMRSLKHYAGAGLPSRKAIDD